MSQSKYFESCSGDKFEFDDKDPLRLFKTFIQEYKCFRDKADSYKDNGEIEGALIYYSLSANSLYHAMMLKDQDNNTKRVLSKDLAIQEWCGDVCAKLGKKQSVVLSIIGDLQEELRKKKLKYEEATKTGTNDDDINCDNIFSKQVLLKGDDCIFFEDVVGQDEAKESIKNGFVWPNVYTNLFPKTSKGILLYGPPGTGKTLLAKATANELNIGSRYDQNLHVLYFAPQGGDLKGKYVGETEKNIQSYFKCASEAASLCQKQKNDTAKQNGKPENHRVLSIIFIDEVDAIARDRTTDDSGMMALSVNALLQALDGVTSQQNVAVIASTNFPWQLDSAFLRRFDQKIMIDLPNVKDIINMINYNINKFVSKIEKYVKATCKKTLNGKKWYIRKKILGLIFPDIPEDLAVSKFQNLSSDEMNFTMKEAMNLEALHGIKFGEEFYKLPEIQKRMYYSDVEPKSFGEYNRKTKNSKLNCEKSCKDNETIRISNWTDSPYKDYIDGLTESQIKTLAVKMKEKNFSPSDISKLCENVFRIVGDRARRNGSFYKMDYSTFCDKQCNLKDDDKNFIPKALYENINVHISTLSLTKIMSKPKACKKVSDRNCIVPIKLPEIKQIVLDLGEEDYYPEIFTHKLFVGKETFISDPNIEDFWINEKEFEDPDTLEVLFKIKIGVQKNLVKYEFVDQYSPDKTILLEPTISTTQEFYVRSSISKRGLGQKWFTWESWKPSVFGGDNVGELEKKYKKRRSTYEELINNMTELIIVEDDVGSQKKYYINTFRLDSELYYGLKNKMLIFDYDKDNGEEELYRKTRFVEFCKSCYMNKNIRVELESIGVNEPSLIVRGDEIEIKKEKEMFVRGEEQDKETFFTFDIRYEDFETELYKTPSSIRMEEYAELIEYKKDPSTYKPKDKKEANQ
ncbi:MAG: ATP-binding protein [Proteobacteria bacterium]|nr:ATP-binding protein [Pseudomonadota bacterium]